MPFVVAPGGTFPPVIWYVPLATMTSGPMVRSSPGVITSFVGAYISYFLDGATGGVIVSLQTLLFLFAFYFAPKHGVLAARRRRREVVEGAA